MAERVSPPEPDGPRPRFVVCGDNPLAVRLVDEPVTRYGGGHGDPAGRRAQPGTQPFRRSAAWRD